MRIMWPLHLKRLIHPYREKRELSRLEYGYLHGHVRTMHGGSGTVSQNFEQGLTFNLIWSAACRNAQIILRRPSPKFVPIFIAMSYDLLVSTDHVALIASTFDMEYLFRY